MIVLISARDERRGRDAAAGLQSEGITAHCIRLDVTSQEAIDQAAHRIAEEFSRLDVLVNNAGIFIDDGPPSGLDMAVLRRTYETNVFGPVAVTRAMLPKLFIAQPLGSPRMMAMIARCTRPLLRVESRGMRPQLPSDRLFHGKAAREQAPSVRVKGGPYGFLLIKG